MVSAWGFHGFSVLKYIILTVLCSEFSFFVCKIAQTGMGSANLYDFQVTYLIFLMSEKVVDKILNSII
jgi:hypothetical protein